MVKSFCYLIIFYVYLKIKEQNLFHQNKSIPAELSKRLAGD